MKLLGPVKLMTKGCDRLMQCTLKTGSRTVGDLMDHEILSNGTVWRHTTWVCI